jgi:AcrR family transcriptional regulator
MSIFPDPPQTPKAEATRKLLLDTAAALFVEHGYDAVSLKDIADDARLTKGAIYGHFRSKGQLLVEVIRTELGQRDRRQPTAAETGDYNMFDSFISPASRELRLLQIDAAAAARHDPDVAAGTAEIEASRRSWIIDSLGSAEHADTLAYIINTLSTGVGIQEAHGRAGPDLDSWRQVMGAMFAAAMAPDPTQLTTKKSSN